jgi:hypothetical protein
MAAARSLVAALRRDDRVSNEQSFLPPETFTDDVRRTGHSG